MPKVSVIIPTCNRSHLLPRAVESARQSGTDIEVIVVDDDSTDETPAVAAALDGIKYIRLEHKRGVADARNVGLIASSSEFVTFLDDDDVRLPGSIDAQLAELSKYPEASYIYAQIINGDCECNPTDSISPEKCKEGDLFWELMTWMCVPWQSVVFKKSCFQKVGLFDPNFNGADDWDICIRVSERFRAVAINEPVVIYRKPLAASGQLSSNWAQLCAVCDRIQLSALQLPRALAASPEQRRNARKKFLNNISDSLVWRADEAVTQGQSRSARLQLFSAIKYRPFRAIRPKLLKVLFQSLVFQGNR